MIKRTDRKVNRSKRHKRVRVHVAGTAERPRLAGLRSLNHLYVQLIDDAASRTLGSASTVQLKAKGNRGSQAQEVREAIRKGMEIAKRNMITVPMVGTTIPHEVNLKLGSARIMLKPAAPGTGVISGGAMRAVIETAGIKDILTKSHGTNNPINTVRATLAALQQLRTAQQVAELRGKEIDQIVGRRLANVYKRAEGGTTNGAAEAAAIETK